MRRFRHRTALRAPAFAAVVLLYLQALMPTLAVLGGGDRGDWIAVCTASGMRYVQLTGEDGTTAPAETQHASVFCPMCLSVQIGIGGSAPSRVEPVAFQATEAVFFSGQRQTTPLNGELGPPLGARAPPAA